MSKIKKKQKALVGFEVDKLDNTAPIKKIVEDLQQKNANAYKLYAHCCGKRPKTTERRGYHWSIVSLPVSHFSDEFNGELCSNYFEQFHYKSTFPKIITPVKNIEKSDPLTGYMKAKSDWAHRMHFLSTRSDACIEKYEKMNEDVAYCPKRLVNMVSHYKSNPDPNFDSLYNWYYTGHGNIQLVTIDHVDYLLRSEFDCLYMSEFIKETSAIVADDTIKFECGAGNNILETVIKHNIVALRTMNRIFILKVVLNYDNKSIDKLKELHSTVAYTSISLDNYHQNVLYITKLDNSLTMVNLDRMTGRNVNLAKPKSLVNNWSCVLTADRSHYCHVMSDGITVYDKRMNNACADWKSLSNKADFHCNTITAAANFDDCVYFGTTHHLFSLDLRYHSNYKPKVLQRWTHNMMCDPTYITRCTFEMNRDFICLSSQWCEDVCLIVSDSSNILKGQNCSGVVLPYHPPSILATLKEARFRMLCHDLYNPIDDRLQTSITGLSLIEVNEKYSLLTQNALGDITSHTIYPEHLAILIEDNRVEALHEWSKSYVTDTKLFVVSDIINVANVMSDLKKVEDTSYLDGESRNDHFSMDELIETFESEKIDSTILDAWGIEGFEKQDKHS